MKKFLAIILTFVLCFGVLSVALAAEDEPVTAVPDGYIGIYTAKDLDNIRNNLSGKYILMNNIDFSSHENWSPIGTSETPFTGELDGNGYSIENMTITTVQEEQFNAGLFGYIKNATVKNLTIDKGKIDVSADKGVYAGLVCGYGLSSEFSNVITDGNININTKGISSVGGIVGYHYESFADKGTTAIEQCSNHTEIAVSASINNEGIYDQIWIGGIVGYTNAAVSRCSNYGSVSLGLDKVDDDFSSSNLGGICGYTFGAVTDCYNTGNVTANGVDSIYAGGISGYWETEKSISNIHNIGEITASSTGEDAKASCYAFVGGARGLAYPAEDGQDSTSLSNMYYLDNMETANENYLSVLLIMENLKKLTAEEFKNQNSFIGFDFENIWIMDENQGYPVFKWEYEEETSEPSTDELTTETAVPVTKPSTQENTTVPVATPIEPSTTEPATSEVITTVKPTESVTNPITEPSTEPDNDIGILEWLIKMLKAIIDFVVKIFVMLGC